MNTYELTIQSQNCLNSFQKLSFRLRSSLMYMSKVLSNQKAKVYCPHHHFVTFTIFCYSDLKKCCTINWWILLRKLLHVIRFLVLFLNIIILKASCKMGCILFSLHLPGSFFLLNWMNKIYLSILLRSGKNILVPPRLAHAMNVWNLQRLIKFK